MVTDESNGTNNHRGDDGCYGNIFLFAHRCLQRRTSQSDGGAKRGQVGACVVTSPLISPRRSQSCEGGGGPGTQGVSLAEISRRRGSCAAHGCQAPFELVVPDAFEPLKSVSGQNERLTGIAAREGC